MLDQKSTISARARFVKFAREWLLAPKAWYAFDRFARRASLRILKGHNRRVLGRNIELRGRYQGRRCFVIGNGPSLNALDLSPLAGEVTIACNEFYESKTLREWHPTVYCVGDPPSEACNAEYFDPIFQRVRPDVFVMLNSMLNEVCRYLEVRHLELSIKKQLYGVMVHRPLDESTSIESIDLCDTIPGFRVTPMLSIMVAMYMGCNPIIVVGCDTDYYAKYFNGEFEEKHLFEEEDSTSVMATWSTAEVARDLLLQYESYSKLNRIALRQGIQILDATHEGRLDTFRKVRYESLLAMKHHEG